jgi:hypothetical protein
MQLIIVTTKYIPGTEHRGERIKATSEHDCVTVRYDGPLSGGRRDAHANAVKSLAKRNAWKGLLYQASVDEKSGFGWLVIDGVDPYDDSLILPDLTPYAILE